MATIILDISPNTHKNNNVIIHRMINDLKKIDNRKHEIIFKTQVFKEAPPNLPITPEALNFFGFCAKLAGYQWTASVFDLDSLELLMKYEEHLPFIKIPCRPDLYWLAGEIKRKIRIYRSISSQTFNQAIDGDMLSKDYNMCCIPDYPAEMNKYEYEFGNVMLWSAISDHTIGFKLWKEYTPHIIEWHYKEPTSTGPDAGPFAKTLEDLKEVL
jgi:hypothetical protein